MKFELYLLANLFLLALSYSETTLAEEEFKPICIEEVSQELQTATDNINSLKAIAKITPALLETERRRILENGIGEISLTCTIKSKNENDLLKLVEKGADPNFLYMGHTPFLHKAVLLNSLNLVKKLIEKGARISSKNHAGDSALTLASQFGRHEILSFLITQGADPKETNEKGETLLHYAASYMKIADETLAGQDLETINMLVNVGINPNSKNLKGQTPLHYALISHTPSYHNSLSRIEKLLDLKANVNEKDSQGRTVLHYLKITEGNLDEFRKLLQLFLKKGANLEVKDNRGMSPFLLNSFLNNTIPSKEFLKVGADVNAEDQNKRTALHYATKKSNRELLELLIQGGININKIDEDGNSAIDFGIDNVNQEDLLLYLLKNKAVFSNLANDSPLHRAARNGWVKIAKYLISVGSDVNQSIAENTPLHIAVMSSGPNRLEMVKLLVEYGADLEAINKSFNTPLFNACSYSRDSEIIEYLLKMGAKTEMGKVSILELMIQIDSKIAKLIINKGANFSYLNDSKENLLHTAILYGDIEIVKMLLEKNISITHRNILGQTPLSIAKLKNKTEIIPLLKSYGATE